MFEKKNLPKMPGFAIAYHGCDKSVAEKVVSGRERLRDSTNQYDWLGHGQYFWEDNSQRALEWADNESRRENSNIVVPAVVGAVIDLGSCLNLVDAYCIRLVKAAYESMKADYEVTGNPMPHNKNTKGNKDLPMRYLDCAVIEYLRSKVGALDTVRGVFLEGKPLYRGSGFRDKTHIQICVMNTSCIVGYFLPINLYI